MSSVPTSPTAITSRIPLATGVTLPILTAGREDGTPVLFLHGLSDSGPSWVPVLAHLPEGVRAIVPTQRGHGDAEKPVAGYAPADMVSDAVAILDTLGVERAVVVGHSMGTVVAQLLGATHPDRVKSLVLIGAFAPLEGHPLVAEADELFGGLVDPVDPAFVREFQESTLAVPIDAAFLDQVVAESLKVPARVWQQAWAGIRDADLASAYQRLTMPVHLICGDRDTFTDRDMQDAIVAALPDVTLSVYAGAGHATHWEQPARFAAELLELVAADASRSGATNRLRGGATW